MIDLAMNHLVVFFFISSMASFCIGMIFGRTLSAIRVVIMVKGLVKDGIVPTTLIAASLDIALQHHEQRVAAGLERELARYQATINAIQEDTASERHR